MASKRKVPKGVLDAMGLDNPHEYRVHKGLEVRAALGIIRVLNRGCAYCPAGREITEACILLELAKKKLSQKNWGK